MKGKLLYSKNFQNDKGLKFAALTEEEEAKLRALDDVETIKILRGCMQDAQFLSEDLERWLRISDGAF
ncbi:MAG: hypothetical protein KKH04_19480 [Proteobacteria bacterium]|nr:hypothetical protein [Pseudomonadota bacterium]